VEKKNARKPGRESFAVDQLARRLPNQRPSALAKALGRVR
jgi:hypothetical protein